MDARQWDRRYGEAELVWSAQPNLLVAEVTAGLPPGRVLDLAAGEGRNALCLAERGWDATAVDFSQVALDRATALADERLGAEAIRFAAVCADLRTYRPAANSYDLVLLVYLQVAEALRAAVLRAAAEALRPGGRLLVVAHDPDNPQHGHGGPSDPDVLYTAGDVTQDLAGSGLEVDRAERVIRRVDIGAGPRDAVDALVVAVRRPAR